MEPDDSRWERARRAFFVRPAAPSAAQTEAFVSRVMAALPADEPAAEAPFWRVHRWFVPALGFSFAAFIFSLLSPGGESEDPATALLLADAGGSPIAGFVAGSDPDTPEAVLGLDMEER